MIVEQYLYDCMTPLMMNPVKIKINRSRSRAKEELVAVVIICGDCCVLPCLQTEGDKKRETNNKRLRPSQQQLRTDLILRAII